MAWSKQPNSILQQVGLATVPTPGDGHCLLHAVRRSWEVQTHSPVPSLEVMLSELHREALVNNGRYKNFFCGPYLQYKDQMYSYLYNKVFDTTFVDLVPLMVCNSLRISLCIFNERNDGHLDFIDVVPSSGHPPRHTIYVHRQRKHYSALEFCSFRPREPVPTSQEADGWRMASSGRRCWQRGSSLSQECQDAVVVQNRFSSLSCEEFPPLQTVNDGNIIKKASNPKPRKIKIKPAIKHINPQNLVQFDNIDDDKVDIEQRQLNDVIVIGTSLVRNLGSRLNAKNVNAIVYTNAGCSIHHIAPRFKQMIPANFKGCVILQIGGNDCSSNDSEHVVNMYDKFITDIHSYVPEAQIMVSAIPPRRGSDYLKFKINTVNEHLHFRASFETYLSFVDCPLTNVNHFAKDGVHFSLCGKTVYADNLIIAIKQFFQFVQWNLVSR